MNAQSGSMRHTPSDGVAPAYRISRARDLGGSLSVTVKTSHLLQVRRAIVQSGIERIGIVKAVPLACGTRVRLLVAVPPQSVEALMDFIMRAVDSGEFGAFKAPARSATTLPTGEEKRAPAGHR
jgi:hypothetical protein